MYTRKISACRARINATWKSAVTNLLWVHIIHSYHNFNAFHHIMAGKKILQFKLGMIFEGVFFIIYFQVRKLRIGHIFKWHCICSVFFVLVFGPITQIRYFLLFCYQDATVTCADFNEPNSLTCVLLIIWNIFQANILIFYFFLQKSK